MLQFQNKPPADRKDWILNLVIPLAYLVVTLSLDYSMPYSTITPLMAISGLMVFAFRLTPPWMIFWVAVYSVVVAFIFLAPGVYAAFSGNLKTPPDPVTPWLRTGTFVLGAILSSVLCATMARLVAGGKSMRELFEKLPIPIITSDINGDIIFANDAAELLMSESGQLLSRNYFDIFPAEDHQGTLIADYLARLSGEKSTVGGEPLNEKPLVLMLGSIPLLGRTHLLKQSSPPLLMTILEHDEGRMTKPSSSLIS
jgi:PAS domain-containing protein